MEVFASDEGREFLSACCCFDPADFDEDDVRKASECFVKFFTSDVEKKSRGFRKMARVSSRLYVMSMEGLEALSMLNNTKTVAEYMKQYSTELYTPEQVSAHSSTCISECRRNKKSFQDL